jgi:hypothetical protein
MTQRNVVTDELHVTVLAPAGLPEARYQAMHRRLCSQRAADVVGGYSAKWPWISAGGKRTEAC